MGAYMLALGLAVGAFILKFFSMLPRVRLVIAFVAGLVLLGTSLPGMLSGAANSVGSGVGAVVGFGVMMFTGIATYLDLARDRKADWMALGSAAVFPMVLSVFWVSSWNMLQSAVSTAGSNLQSMFSGIGG